GQPIVFSAAKGNPIWVSDVDAGKTLPVRVTLTARNGLVKLSQLIGLTFVVGDGRGNATMTFTGTIVSINAALNGMVFVADANTASLTITTNDLGHSGAGGALSALRDTDTVLLGFFPPPPPI